jgi:hypothetical protein
MNRTTNNTVIHAPQPLNPFTKKMIRAIRETRTAAHTSIPESSMKPAYTSVETVTKKKGTRD